MALGERCSMAGGRKRGGERADECCGGEGVVCVGRRWAFKTRAVSGARLSLPPPTQPTCLLPYLAWHCLPRIRRCSPCLACFGSSAR